MLFVGPIKERYLICHSCDNPACVRPDHLFQGTPKDNVHDMLYKGRGGFKVVETNGKTTFKLSNKNFNTAKLDRTQVKEIKVSTLPIKDLAAKYNVKYHTIYDILKGRTWKEV